MLRAFGGGDPATADAGQAELAFPTPGEKGHADGGPDQALFNEPQGLALLPEDVAERVGYDVVVADSVNHRLRGLRLSDGHVSTLAGNGVQKLIDSERAKEAAAVDDEGDVAVDLADLPGEPTAISLSSPWDVVWHPALGRVVIAMAGTHQLFDFDPVTGALAVHAGTALEGLLDGDAGRAWFAQPSGLSVGADGTLWVADSETSAVRWVRTGEDGRREVGTAVGAGLFDFGHVDGEADRARLQHALGVTALPDGSVREDKIAAIGVKLRRWVSFHGIAINVEPDLTHYGGIVPCGISGHGVTSLVDLGLPVGMADLDVALRRNDRDWIKPVPPEWADQVAATLSYSHFLCHVFHLDYVLKKGADPAAFKKAMLAMLDAEGAEYPAEHNVGHLYHAKPQLAAFYEGLDPLARFNPGIGGTRRS